MSDWQRCWTTYLNFCPGDWTLLPWFRTTEEGNVFTWLFITVLCGWVDLNDPKNYDEPDSHA